MAPNDHRNTTNKFLIRGRCPDGAKMAGERLSGNRLMSERKSTKLGRRVLLALLTLYALAMILPDFARIVRPLGSFGLTTNADERAHL